MGHYACDMRPEWFEPKRPQPKVTDWYEPHQKPVRVGWFEACIFDAGWIYEWRVWWDGKVWREKEGGLSLIDQNLTWRGQTA